MSEEVRYKKCFNCKGSGLYSPAEYCVDKCPTCDGRGTIEVRKSTYVVCFKGYGEGCDYTIACNQRFEEMEAFSLEELIDQIHHGASDKSVNFDDELEGNEYTRIYMSGIRHHEYEHTFESVFVVKGKLIDVSAELRDKIRQDLDKLEAATHRKQEKAEEELYLKLKNKYDKKKA